MPNSTAAETSKTQHTPGPWVAAVALERDHGGYRPIFADGLWHILQADHPSLNPIATVDHANDHHAPTRAKAEADARLIAAAPDLLEAAKLFEKTIRYLIGIDEKSGDEEGVKLKTFTLNYVVLSAIAKAEG